MKRFSRPVSVLIFRISLFSTFFSSFFSSRVSARELSYYKPQLYYELLLETGLSLATQEARRRYGPEGEGKTSFFSQTLDDQVTTWIHGGSHSPEFNARERRYNVWSDDIQDVVKYSALLSPLFKPEGHRLGTLLTIIHTHNIWYLMSYTLKHTVERQRPKYYYTRDPRTKNTKSFPSGHTGRTFVMASITDMVFDLPTWARVGLYGAAGSVAVLRVASDKHFFTDVVAAMGLAYFSAWFSYKTFEEQTKEEGSTTGLHLNAGPRFVGVSYRINF